MAKINKHILGSSTNPKQDNYTVSQTQACCDKTVEKQRQREKFLKNSYRRKTQYLQRNKLKDDCRFITEIVEVTRLENGSLKYRKKK